MSKRRMVGWRPLAVENQDATVEAQPPAEPEAPVEQTAPEPAAPAAPIDQPQVEQPAVPAAEPAPAAATSGPVQDSAVQRRRMVGWQPLTVANSAASTPITPAPAQAAAAPAAPVSASPAEPVAEIPVAEDPVQPAAGAQPAAASGPIQDPNIPRRRMAGWQPLTVAHDAPVAALVAAPVAESAPAAVSAEQPEQPVETAQPASSSATPIPAAPVTEDIPRRRMTGWQPLQVGHPDSVVPAVLEEPAAASEPETAPAKPARKRMGAPTASPAAPVGEPEVTMPEVVTPPAAKEPTAPKSAEKKPKETSSVAKVLITLGIVAIVAAGVVLLAQWVRSMDPVAEFIATYDGTPTHPDGVEAGIPGWVGWQHFFNFFIIVMVIRSGLLIRYQDRPEAYWTPTKAGIFSPGQKNSPAKVSIQQWIHQSFNVLWVVNGLYFYVMVFVTGHWMRLVPTNWDIFPNILSAGIQYMSLDWPPENSWVYYNALQITTYFLTVFIAAPLAVLTGLRISTWWPQSADGINKAFPLPVARKVHFGTMIYFVAFIIVHLFLVFTTGVLTNLNMMFTSRDAHDWWGIGVFAVSVAVTVGVAWLMKPMFISPIAEKTGQVSTR